VSSCNAAELDFLCGSATSGRGGGVSSSAGRPAAQDLRQKTAIRDIEAGVA